MNLIFLKNRELKGWKLSEKYTYFLCKDNKIQKKSDNLLNHILKKKKKKN
jgi:hypothetical protein